MSSSINPVQLQQGNLNGRLANLSDNCLQRMMATGQKLGAQVG
jgi:hypothetical protein